jgi:capsular exopolysaccharide synthesis family protein
MEIKTFTAPLLKWWWLIMLAAVLAGASSYYAVRDDPAIYQTKATLMAGRPFDDPNPNSSQFYLSQQLASSYAEIARREPIRLATQEALGLNFLPAYNVSVPNQTQLIEIAVSDTDAARAQAVANELAHQMVLLSPGGQDADQEGKSAFIEGQLNDLAKQIEETQLEIAQLQDDLGEMFSAREIADTQGQITALQNKLSTLQSNYAGFLANSNQEATNVLKIVESAAMPRQPVGSSNLVTIVVSVSLAIVLAAGAAYVLEYLDDSISSEEDIRLVVNLPVLASLEKNGGLESDPTLTLNAPRSPLAESFRDLRTRVRFLSLNEPQGSLLITSANPSEGKSFTSANLAIVMAQAGYKTVLVDADLRRPKQHDIFDASNEVGLSNLIMEGNAPIRGDETGTAAPLGDLIDQVVQSTQQGGLGILTAGTLPPNPSELIGSTGMIAVMEALKERYDYIVVDSSPCLAVTDVLLLSVLTDSVILVARAGQTGSKSLKKAVARLREVDAAIAGVVLNGDAKTSRYGYPYTYSEAESPDDAQNEVTDSFGNRLRRWFGRSAAKAKTEHSQFRTE